jgi:hypothetical protein
MKKLLIGILCFSFVQISYGTNCTDNKENYKTSLENYRTALNKNIDEINEDELKRLESIKNVDKDLVDESCEVPNDWSPGVGTFAAIVAALLAVATIANFMHGWGWWGQGRQVQNNVQEVRIVQVDGTAFRVHNQ